MFRSNIDWNDQTQPPASLLAGNASQIVGNNSSLRLRLRRAQQWGGNYNVAFNNARATTNNIFTNFNPQLALEHQRELHAAAAPQLQDRRDAPAAAGLAEEPRDLRRAAAAVDRAHREERQERLLRHDVLGGQPERAAPIAGAGAAIAQGQPRPGGDRDDGAHRHRAGRSRSRPARGERHPRRGRYLAGRGPAPRARVQPLLAGLLAPAHRADRAGAVPAHAGRHRRRRRQRPAEADRPEPVPQAARSHRREHPVLQEPDAAGRERVAHLLRAGHRRHVVHSRSELGLSRDDRRRAREELLQHARHDVLRRLPDLDPADADQLSDRPGQLPRPRSPARGCRTSSRGGSCKARNCWWRRRSGSSPGR